MQLLNYIGAYRNEPYFTISMCTIYALARFIY